MENEFVPVLLFVYCRPMHTEKVLQYLNKNTNIEETELYIYSDGPKAGKEEEVKNVREKIGEFLQVSKFRNVIVKESEANNGLANSIISGVTSVISKYGRVIVLEDDLLTSEDFYMYMKEALKFYQDNEKIWSIAGYSPVLKSAIASGHDVYLCSRAGSWGWATWDNRWSKVDWQVSDYRQFKRSPIKRIAFDNRGTGMTKMLDMQMEGGKIDSWAIRWCYQQFKSNMFTINPVFSKVKNIGCDGSGTHSKSNMALDISNLSSQTTKYEIVNYNRKIAREYDRCFRTNTVRDLFRKIKLIFT